MLAIGSSLKRRQAAFALAPSWMRRLNPQVICGQHGWWQAAPRIGAPDAITHSDGANFNLLIGNEAIDPVSGSVPHRSYVCQVRRVEEAALPGGE